MRLRTVSKGILRFHNGFRLPSRCVTLRHESVLVTLQLNNDRLPLTSRTTRLLKIIVEEGKLPAEPVPATIRRVLGLLQNRTVR